MKNSKINGSTFIIKKRGFDIADVIHIVCGLLMSIITIIMTINSIKNIVFSLPVVVFFVYLLRGILYRSKDKQSFINFSERGVICLDIIKHYDFSYEWREIISVKFSENRGDKSTYFYLKIYTKDSFYFFEMSDYDISIVTLEHNLKIIVPKHLLEFEKKY